MKKNLRSMIEAVEEGRSYVLLDMNNYDVITGAGLKADPAHKKNAHMSALWYPTKQARVSFATGGADLSGMRYLTFSVMGIGASGVSFRLLFDNSATGEGKDGYVAVFTVCKDGWNDYRVELPFMHALNAASGWNAIGSITLEYVGGAPEGVRQTMLFSATLEESILRLSAGWLAEPAVIESEPEKLVSENIDQTFYSVSRDEKLGLLLYLLRTREYERVIIFGNRKDVNSRLQYELARYGYNVPLLSGDIPQQKRIQILEKFRTGEEKIVIATDVAARGIHVDNVSLVVNYDLPERSEDYVHRIGRTGRAGQPGKAISFICEYGAYYMPDIEKYVGETFKSTLPGEDMVKIPTEYAELLKSRRSHHSRNNGHGGGNYRRGSSGGRSGGYRR
jgi:hypothetical protein